MSKTSRSSFARLDGGNPTYALEFFNLLRLVLCTQPRSGPFAIGGSGELRLHAFQTYARHPLLDVVLVLLAAGLVAGRFASIKSTGIPHGPAMRLPHHIGQMIVTPARYVPTLHRDEDKDRYRLDLPVVSLDDAARQETFTLQRPQKSNATQLMTKVLGADGVKVWVQALDIFAVNLKTK